MTQSPVTVTYSLENVLGEISNKLDNLQKDVQDLKVGQVRLETELIGTKAELKTEISGIKAELKAEIAGLKTEISGVKAELKTEISGVKEDIKEIKGSQKAQIWTLIGILGTAVLGIVIRFVITALPGNL